jgi:hypothetical protein
MNKRRKIILALIILIIAAVSVMGWLGFRRYGRNQGVELKASHKMEPPDITYYLQRDEAWAEDSLGNSRFTMGSSGCLVTSIASMLDSYGIEVTPGELNQMFTSDGVYNDAGDVIWGNLTTVYPDMKVEVFSSVSSREVEKKVEQGQYPLVKVRYLGSGYWHWVLLIGSDVNGYLCMDPLYDDKKPRPLSDHGGKIYSWRLLTMPEN